MDPRTRILPYLVRSERVLREVFPQEAGHVQEMIQVARGLPSLVAPPLPVIEPPPPETQPLRRLTRKSVPPAKRTAEAAPARPARKKHLVLVHPAPAPDELQEVARKPAPPDPIGDKMREAEGARALLLEIVRRAAYDWVLYRQSTRLDQKALAEDAYTWLFVEDEEHPNWDLREKDEKEITGFVAICDALDLSAERVRKYVRALTPNRVMSSGRPPENSRASDHVPNITLHTKVASEGSGGGNVDFDAIIGMLDGGYE